VPTFSPALLDAIRLPERLSVSEWAERNVVLGEDGPEPGQYRSGRTPYSREWQDSVALPWIHQITVCAGTQLGKSQSGLNVMSYAIAQDPGPMTVVLPTKEDAEEFGENRLLPQLERSPTLKAQLGTDRYDAKKRQIRTRRCRVLFRSAVKAKELAAYPARWLFLEEASKLVSQAGAEAAPFALARERTTNFWNHKIYLSSTPLLADGLITVEFENGDRRRYHVPCPHCGTFQVLVWKQVKWDDERDDTEAKILASGDAWYECTTCREKIRDHHKPTMLARGVWVPEGREVREWCESGRAADRAPHRSYHLWAGYSPWITFPKLVGEFLRQRKNPKDLQNFINSKLAEPWVEKVEESKPAALRECIGGYRRGDCPEGVRFVTAAVDVQKRFLSFTVRGWGLDMENWLLDHNRVGDFAQLVPLLFGRQWPRGLRVRAVFMDARYRTRECIAFAKKHPQVALCRGVEFDDPLPMRGGQPVERHPVTGQPVGTVRAWHLNVLMFKDELHGSIRGAEGFGRFHVYEDVDETYLEEMTSEHKIVVREKKKDRERWVKKAGHRQNHYWDTECYQRALALRWGVAQMRGASAGARRPSAPAEAEDHDEGEGRLWRRT
jgi:phage terminase large subunit GpA-like protein